MGQATVQNNPPASVTTVDEPQVSRPFMPSVSQAPQQESAPKSLADLFLTGRAEKTFDVGGYKFKMRTLRSDETTDALDAASQFIPESDARENAVRINILARSVASVNDQPLDYLFSLIRKPQPESELSPLMKKITVVSTFPQVLLMRLFLHYNELMDSGTNEMMANSAAAEAALKNS